MNVPRSLRQARAAGSLREVDEHLARHLLELAPKPSASLAFAVAALSRAQGNGDICLDLAACAGGKLFARDMRRDAAASVDGEADTTRAASDFDEPHLPGEVSTGAGSDDRGSNDLESSANALPAEWTGVAAPSLPEWRTALLDSGLVGDSAADGLPLVLDAANRLYFAKYHAFEQGIARGLLARAAPNPVASDTAIERMLDAHFGRADTASDDRRDGAGSRPGSDRSAGGQAGQRADPHQRAAARAALTRQLAVITGGPGTGKTTTVARILAAMIGLAVEAGGPLPRIHLAAPTGKAAARLGDSLRTAKARMPEASNAVHIPEKASTLHRLIGMRPDTRLPRFDARNTLALDVLVIDEASMIDLPLMARVMAALPPHARLVLLGDADQLASVEAGAVLGDICGGTAGAPSRSPMRDSIARLVTSHRFDAGRGIGALAQAINAGAAERALSVCHDDPAVTLVSGAGPDALKKVVAAGVDAYRTCLAATDVAEATRRFGAFRVLCALREGPWGVEAINAAMERALALEGYVDRGKRHWRGRPLLITANDYGVELFNGDIGLVWPDDEGNLRACFVGPDGRVKRLPLSRLPAHETALAMTVHKAQGSEFDRVALVLPDRDSPVLTRELVYTAVTRARNAVEIHGTEELLGIAIRRCVARSSGLRDAIWGAPAG